MGYLKIQNLYKDQTVLNFKEVYVLEKIHGTSAHISFGYRGSPLITPTISFFAGGGSYEEFKKLFNEELLMGVWSGLKSNNTFIVYGESYGGKQQKMSETYGKAPKFVAFDVLVITESRQYWLSVPLAEEFCKKFGIEFVYWEKVECTPEKLNEMRDRPSIQAKRNGIEGHKTSEGIVIRPLIEFITNSGNRVIAKHKTEAFSERASKRDTNLSPEKMQIISKAEDIANEFATEMRFNHVWDKLSADNKSFQNPSLIPFMCHAMIEDIRVECKDEFVDSKETQRAISKKTSQIFKSLMKEDNFGYP